MIPIPLILGAITGLLSLFGSAKSASDSVARGRRVGAGNQLGGGQQALPQGTLQIPKYDPQTMQGLQQILGMGLQGWQQNQPNFGPIADKARADFQSITVPSIAERFAGTSRRSSGLEGTLGAAGAGLDRDLSAMQQGFGQQNRNQLLQLLQLGLTPQYESLYKTQQPGFWENVGTSAIPAAIQYSPQIIKAISDAVASSQNTGG